MHGALHETRTRLTVGGRTNRLSYRTLNRTFPLNNGGIATASGSLSALSAHSAFSLSANAESDAANDHPHTRCGTFFNDPASLRSRFLNDVVVRKGWRDDESRQSSTSQNCAHGKSFRLNENPARAGLLGSPSMLSKGRT